MLVQEVDIIAAIGPSGFYEARRRILREDSLVVSGSLGLAKSFFVS